VDSSSSGIIRFPFTRVSAGFPSVEKNFSSLSKSSLRSFQKTGKFWEYRIFKLPKRWLVEWQDDAICPIQARYNVPKNTSPTYALTFDNKSHNFKQVNILVHYICLLVISSRYREIIIVLYRPRMSVIERLRIAACGISTFLTSE